VRWEYYLGGMLAALLSFVLRAMPAVGEEIIGEAIAAGLRAVAWFFAFGVLERVAWSRGEYVSGLVVGIVACLALLLVAPGLTYPSVAGLLWIAVALVLALVNPPVEGWLGRQGWVSAIALPLFLGGGFGYLALIYSPAAIAAYNIQKARLATALFFIDHERKPEERTIRDPSKYVRERILAPLEEADKNDRGNVRTRVLLVSWWVQLWAINPWNQPATETAGRALRGWAEQARLANPEGREPYLAEYEARIRIATVLRHMKENAEKDMKKKPKQTPAQKRLNTQLVKDLQLKITNQYQFAVNALKPYLSRDPTDPHLHYRLAEALFEGGAPAAGREEAAEADRLDSLVGPQRKLRLEQRAQLVKWLEEKSSP
jgi:hypothetical protein